MSQSMWKIATNSPEIQRRINIVDKFKSIIDFTVFFLSCFLRFLADNSDVESAWLAPVKYVFLMLGDITVGLNMIICLLKTNKV